ncbi:MAG: GxGYxYP domain-containing protein, partial [Candidatus Dormibacteraceae bacterium]
MSIIRRDLLKLGGLAAGASTLGLPALAVDVHAEPGGGRIIWPPGQALPAFAPPVHLDVADIQKLDRDTQTLMTTLQGVVNRTRPRLYCLLFADDHTWLQTARVPFTLVGDPWTLVAKYAAEAKGSIVWDPAVPDSLNVATSLAGLENAVVASADLAKKLAGAPYNLPVLKDLRGQFSDKVAAYNWALSALWPQLTHRMLIGIAPQLPGVSSFPYLRDYIVANRALVFWLDPAVQREANLFASILNRVAPNTPYLGWFVDQHESQGVTLCSQHGVPVLAADFVTNLTVWSGVPGQVRAEQPQAQTPALENKIYLTIT